MLSLKNVKKRFVFSILVIFTAVIFAPHIIEGQTDPFSTAEEKIKNFSQEESEILQNIFNFSHEIERMEKEQAQYAQEIEVIKQEIRIIEKVVANEETLYQDNKAALKYVLKSYQRNGPGSMLEIILQSENISTLLKRLNILRDFSRNMRELLASLDQSREKLSAQQIRLSEKIIDIQNNQEKLNELLMESIKGKEEKEAYMASLKEQRLHYEEYQEILLQEWNALKYLFPKITAEFSRILQEENLPEDVLKITGSFFSLTGFLEDKSLNDMIAAYADLPEMRFRFYQGKVEIEIPKSNLILTGTFVIDKEQGLKFQVEKAHFHEMFLQDSVVEELFKEGDLLLSFKPLLGKSRLDKIEIVDGYLEVIIIPVLF